MSGVEILSIIEKPVLLFNKEAFGITFFITLVVFFFIGSYMAITESEWIYFIAIPILGIIAGVVFGLMTGALFAQKTDEVEITYKVTISEEVSLNDFMEKYEIIDQEGKIYTVRERGE